MRHETLENEIRASEHDCENCYVLQGINEQLENVQNLLFGTR